MENDVNRIEFVKTQKTKNTSQKPANIFFKSVLIALFIHIYMYFLCIFHIFLKVIFFIIF